MTSLYTDASFSNRVFINCPFDNSYDALFKASIYTILACGFYPISALQENDGGSRLDRIYKLIGSCKFSIHDITKIDLDADNGFPRLNMPFELGLDYGCRFFGSSAQKGKSFLILESSKYQSKIYLSDLAGSDPCCHDGQPEKLITLVYRWLNTAVSDEFVLPTQKTIKDSFKDFCEDLPSICDGTHSDVKSISYKTLTNMMLTYIRKYPQLIRRPTPV